MSKHFFWLTKDQFAKIAPYLPTDTRGVKRVDDRRVISGIVHVLKPGGRWTDAPRDQYGPHKTLYNRFVRWAEKGVWNDLFEALAAADGPPALYRKRNAVERSFCRLKDFRRIATRYDRFARNFLAAVQLTATVCYWL